MPAREGLMTMVTQAWDVNGEARAALSVVVKDYGVAALSNPQILGSLLKDLMPDSPRESSILVAAAEADVPGMLRDRMAQRISSGAAVAQAAHLLEERTALAPEACQWASRQLAELIGLPADVPAGAGTVPPPPAPETRSWHGQSVSQPQPPPQSQPQQPWSGPQQGTPQQPWAGPQQGTPQQGGPQQPWAGPQQGTPQQGGPQQPWAGPQQGTPQQPWAGPQAGLRPSPTARRGPALVAAIAAIVCAGSVSGQTFAHGGLAMWYDWEIALAGLVTFASAIVSLRDQTRYLGVGLIFGASLVMATIFLSDSVLSGLGGGFVAASIVTTVTALVAAVSSAVCFGREVRAGNLRPPLAVIYSLAALGLVVATIPGFVQYNGLSGGWFTVPGMVGSGVHGRFLFAGLAGLAFLVISAVMAGLLPPGSGVRAGVIVGWLAVGATVEIGGALNATQPYVRPAPALWISLVMFAVALGLAIPLLAGSRRRPAAST